MSTHETITCRHVILLAAALTITLSLACMPLAPHIALGQEEYAVAEIENGSTSVAGEATNPSATEGTGRSFNEIAAAKPDSNPEEESNGTERGGTDNTSGKRETAKRKKTARYAKVAKVKMDKKSATIHNNGKVKFKAVLIPNVADKKIENRKIKWKVSDRKVADITQKGVVQGKRAGTVQVTATASNGKTATARVRVVIDDDKMAEAIPVLTYHRIVSDAAKAQLFQGENLMISASSFESQMKWLKASGYHTVSTSQFRSWRVHGTFLPKKSVLITIDDGCYETYHIAYPILKRYKLKATSFLIGANTKKRTCKYNPADRYNRYIGLDVIKKIERDYPNLEFQSHTYDMHHRGADGYGVAMSWSREMIDADFAANERFGFTAIAYPYGHASYNMLAAARSSKSIRIGFGYQMFWPATRSSPLYNIPRFKIMGEASLREFQDIVRTAR